MPPRTRSVTTRSRPPNPPSLPTLEEDLRNLDVEGESPSPVQPLSPEYDPGAGRRLEADGIENRTTPKTRKITRTIASSQRDRVRDADPNEGRCLLTNRPAAVQICHLVAQATNRETLTKLEYVWELGYQRFNVDTRHNMMHLRSDWHFLFDQPKWILVPEIKFVEKLRKIYLDDGRPTCKIEEQFIEPTYQYYVVPAPTLQELICRFPDVNNHRHETHIPPFSELGPLTSHIHPHYVIFNTGQKLLNNFRRSEVTEMRRFLSRNSSITIEDATSALDSIEDLYTMWMEMKVPAHWSQHHAPSNPPHPPGEDGQDDASQGKPPRRQGLRSAKRSQGQGSQASAQGQHHGGQQRAVLPFQPPEDDDSSSVTDDTVVEDDTAWIEYIHNWQKQGASEFGTADGWRMDVLNNSNSCDKQLVAYINEHARTPPSPGAWDSWKPTCDTYQSSHPSASDRSRFSSNDWAVFKNDVYLTRPGH